jgi:phosphoribosylformylglycinamidine cyclo-ligase
MGRPDPYAAAGVDYEVLDPAKRAALAEATATSGLLAALGGRAIDASRGEPAFVFEINGLKLAFVVEGLGTKSTLCRAYLEQTGVNTFDAIGRDAVAAIVNDLICVGATPLVVNAYFAMGRGWLDIPSAHAALVAGWRGGCEDAGAVWGGGESPALPSIVAAGEIDLAGAAVGQVPSGRSPILGEALAAGDAIVLVESSGLHANGASIAQRVAGALPAGLRSPMPSGRSFGEGLLVASHSYAALVNKLLAEDLPVTYLSHITGHGLRKVQRAQRELTYRLHTVLPVPEVLEFLVSQAQMTPREAYGTFNMGCGFAVYCRSSSADRVVAVAAECGLRAVVAGTVEEGPRQVVLEPLEVTFGSEELKLR